MQKLAPKTKIIFLVCQALLIFALFFGIDGARRAEAQVGAIWTQATPAAAWPARWGHTSLVFDNKMWVLGGYDGVNPRNDVWYSTDGITWTQATPSAAWPKRWFHTSLVFDNKMWVLGGRGSAGYLNDVWYSTDGITWTQATPAAAWPVRWYFASVAFDNKMWVLGGYDATNPLSPILRNDVWYSTDGITWTQATPAAAWAGRWKHTSVVFNNKMWVIGGDSMAGFKNDVWYSTDGITWTQATPNADWSIRTHHTSVVADNKMWVMGGDTIGSYLNDVWYSTDGITWASATLSAAWSARLDSTSVAFNNKMWVMGGGTGIFLLNDVWHSTLPSPPPTCALVANPNTITAGNSTSLEWTTTDATGTSIDQGVGAVAPVAAGNVNVAPAATITYTMTVTGLVGNNTCNAAVTVNPAPPTCTVSVSPGVINAGDSSTLSWTTTNATGATINIGAPNLSLPSGSRSTTPMTTTTYTVTVTGPGGTNTCLTTLVVTGGRIPTKSIPDAMMDAIRWSLGFAVSLAVVVLIIAGIVYASSSGDANKAKIAKGLAKYTLMGLIVCGVSYAILVVLDKIF